MGYFNNKKVTNIYFKSKEPLYKELNYTYLIFLLDNWEKLIKFYNKKNIIRLGNNINNLLVNPQIQKLWYNRWSKILLNNWGYNFKPLNKENLKKYNENGYISKFDNRLMYIPDLFNLTSTEYEIYKDSFLVNIEYKNYKESDALFRFYLNKNYKIFWEKLKELGIKNKKLTLKNLKKNNLLNYFNNSQILIYTDFNKTNKDMVYQYLLLNLWYIYMNIDIYHKDRELIKNELLKEGLNKNLLIESGNIIYVINNIRKFCLYKYEFNKDCKLKGITIEGKNYINSLEKKLNIVNNKLLNIFNFKKNNILNQISKLINYDKNNFKINIGDLNNDSWKNKFSLLKYNRENNYNRIIIDKLFYNPIFLGNLHILNPYKYDKNRNVNYENFDYNIYQNPEEQIDYTNIIEISVENKVKGSTVYVMNELNLYSDLIYVHKPFWILNWVNGSGNDDDEVFDEYSDFHNKKLLEDDYFSFFKEFPLKYQYISNLDFILENGSNIGLNIDITTSTFYKGNPYLK